MLKLRRSLRVWKSFLRGFRVVTLRRCLPTSLVFLFPLGVTLTVDTLNPPLESWSRYDDAPTLQVVLGGFCPRARPATVPDLFLILTIEGGAKEFRTQTLTTAILF